ncbi:Uma2 family endonuclease [Bacillus sp. FJAT-49754]|uniref:Uma2 family endonuclease n=2 Tax=Lederbergia citrea TaxID=2833581 RepID=A0A942UK98_9BACI|nr:Uma2 family endonuclease [Lederbergia citrea]MBS4221257.1 Uma2 family endonuclease [Lederbergia citrea]
MTMPHDFTDKKITYQDYLHWNQDIICEAIDGVIYNMTPAPTPRHQEIIVNLIFEFKTYLKDKKCKVYTAPIDVCLFAKKETPHDKISNWVQPDFLVVCDKNKIDEKRIIGPPEFIIEILSPSTARADRLLKYNKYEQAGVKEYWIVDPLNETIEIFLLENGSFLRSDVLTKEDTAKVRIFDDYEIQLKNIFAGDEY